MSDINTGRTGTPLGDVMRELAALRAENSELRGLLAETVPDPEYRRMQDIEIERLREERKQLREALEKAQGGVTGYAKQYVALRAEIDRLRELFKKYMNHVAAEEGSAFMPGELDGFSAEEVEALEALDAEAAALAKEVVD